MTTELQHIKAEPLTRAAFAPFGDVIEGSEQTGGRMNDGRFSRYNKVASIDITPPEKPVISIVRCMDPCTLPYQFAVMERHPLGSQAFVPLSEFVFVVVVARAGERPEAIRAFVSNGQQGISYHLGTWHMPLIATTAEQSFLVIDREGSATQNNCDIYQLPQPLILDAPE